MSYSQRNANGQAASAASAPVVIASDQSAVLHGVWDGAAVQPLRHPNIFKQAGGAGTTIAVWTPVSGKKFRLLRYAIDISADAATSGGARINFTLEDNVTSMNLIHSAVVPSTSSLAVGGLMYTTGWVDLGGIGILSAVANNAFQVLMSAALTSGTVRVRAAGIEE